MNVNNEKGSSVLARVYFHDLPDEQDYEVHDEKHMSGGCDGCVPAYIVPRAAWEDAQTAIAQRDARIEEQALCLSALLTECDPMKLNTGEPWCRARALIAGAQTWTCSECGRKTADESAHFDHISECELAALKAQPSAVVPDRDGLVAAVCVLKSQGLGNLAGAVSDALNVLESLNSSPVSAGDGMCNADNPAARCICREEFGRRVCAGGVDERAAQQAAIAAEFPALSYGADQRDIDRQRDRTCYFARGWQARAALNAGSAVPDGRIEWTPVSQRLPEKGQQIVVYRHGKSPFAGVFDPLGEQLRCLDRWSGKWWEFSLWMPVPTDCLVFTAPTAKKEG